MGLYAAQYAHMYSTDWANLPQTVGAVEEYADCLKNVYFYVKPRGADGPH